MLSGDSNRPLAQWQGACNGCPLSCDLVAGIGTWRSWALVAGLHRAVSLHLSW